MDGPAAAGPAADRRGRRLHPRPVTRFEAVSASHDNEMKKRRRLEDSLTPTGDAGGPAEGVSTSDPPVQREPSRAGRASKVKWTWIGEPLDDPHDEAPEHERVYIHYPQVRCTPPSSSEFVLSIGDGVHLKAEDDTGLPYVARIRGLCESRKPQDIGVTVCPMMVIIEWFFRPEDLTKGRLPSHGQDELFMRRTGKNAVGFFSLDCVESKCTVLSFDEYCRHHASLKRAQRLGLPCEPPEDAVYFVRDWHDNKDIYRLPRSRSHRSHRVHEAPATVSGPRRKDKTNRDRAKATINHRNIKGETKLHTACIRGNIEKVRSLLRMNASVDVSCNAGWTPLHEACQRDHVPIAQLLLKYDADVNIPSPDGTLPIHDAAANQSIEMVSVLIRHGASTTIPDNEGNLPADMVEDDDRLLELLCKKQRHRRVAAMHADAMTSAMSEAGM